MVDTAKIDRPGDPTFDPNTGLSTSGSTPVRSAGPCRVRQPNAVETTVMFGERDVTKQRFVACFPHDVTGVEIGDVVTVTESDDADLVDLGLTVVSVSGSTFVAYKAFGCELVA